jgi:N-acetylmuramoyl-L-alanine amidase
LLGRMVVGITLCMGLAWLMQSPEGDMRKAYIVVHCSDTPASMDIGARDIDQWHTRQGWQGIGYHYVIRRNGTLEPGRSLDQQGAHTKGYNHNSVGVCLVGGHTAGKPGKPEDSFTPAQLDTLKQLLTQLHAAYPQAKVVGHRDLNHDRTCPSFNVSHWLASQRLAMMAQHPIKPGAKG